MRNSASASTTVVTATSWVDASPISTSTLISVPTGTYALPLNEVAASFDTCVVNPALSSVWGCMPPTTVDLTVSDVESTNETQVQFAPYPLTVNFTYGPQPPDLGGKDFTLAAFIDKDNIDLGPAMFFYTEYTKVVIRESIILWRCY